MIHVEVVFVVVGGTLDELDFDDTVLGGGTYCKMYRQRSYSQ